MIAVCGQPNATAAFYGQGWEIAGYTLRILDDDGPEWFCQYVRELPILDIRVLEYVEGVTRIQLTESAVELEQLEKIIIPSTVRDITPSHIDVPDIGCIEIAPSNPYYRMIDRYLVDMRTGLLVFALVLPEHAIVPDGITAIAEGGLSYQPQMRSVYIPSSVELIESRAFSYNDRLETVFLPNSLQTLQEIVFSGCDSLKTLALPDGVELELLTDNELYAVLGGSYIDTLVFCGDIQLYLNVFDSVHWPEDGSGRVIFLGAYNSGIQIEYITSNFPESYMRLEYDICYRAKHADTWAPNGETDMDGFPLRPLTEAEEQALIALQSDILQQADAPLADEELGWRLLQTTAGPTYQLHIYSEAGLQACCAEGTLMVVDQLVFHDGMQVINIPSHAALTVTAEVLLPLSTETVNLQHLSGDYELVLDPRNTTFRLESGQLIEVATGRIVCGEGMDAAAPAAITTSLPALATPSPAPTVSPTQEEPAKQFDIFALVAALAAVGIVVLVALLLVKHKRAKSMQKG